MNVNSYKNTEDTQKQTNIYEGKDGSFPLYADEEFLIQKLETGRCTWELRLYDD